MNMSSLCLPHELQNIVQFQHLKPQFNTYGTFATFLMRCWQACLETWDSSCNVDGFL